MKISNSPQKSSSEVVLSVRFLGGQLDTRNLPIYDLGQVLIAAQRLFHKAYLVEHERLQKRAFPEKAERRRIALQVGTHQKGSDVYTLVPFLADPTVLLTLKSAAKFVMSGLGSYALKDVLDRLRGKGQDKTNIYIGSIHAEVINFVDRIDGTGEAESIQIGCPMLPQIMPIEFTRKTREYAHAITGEFYLGPVQNVVGVAYKLYPNISMIEIRKRPANKKCKLFMTLEEFDRVRYGDARTPLLTVTGRPRFKIGTERHSFDEFEVTKIDSLDDEDPRLPVASE